MKKLIVALNNKNGEASYLYSKGRESKKELDFSSLERAIFEAKELGFNYLRFSGADPLQYYKFSDLLEKASKLNYLIDIEVGSSDLSLFLPLLKKQNIDKLIFVFASKNSEINDSILGKGFFERLNNNIKIATDNNFSIHIEYLINKNNFSTFYDDLKFFEKFTLDTKDIWPGGDVFKSNLLIEGRDVLEYWPIIKKNIFKINTAESNFEENKLPAFVQGKEIFIDWNGDIKPFPYSEIESCGNICREDFKSILQKLSKRLDDLIIESTKEGKFLNWDYYYNKFIKRSIVFKNKISWSTIDNITLPSQFSVLMTQKCNFCCDFCEFECSENKKESIEICDFEKLLQEGKKIGISKVVLDGGEPLTHPEIIQALKLCNEYGYSVTILTNGWLFEKYLPYFKKYNIKNFIFGINGATAKTNDCIMGKAGAFDKQVQAIKKSKEAGFFTGLHIALHPLNVDELDDFFCLAHEWDVDYIMVSRIIEVGKAEKAKFRLNHNQIEKIRTIYRKHFDFLNKIKFFAVYRDDKRYLNCKYLEKNTQLSVHWNGQVALCSMLPLLGLPFKRIHGYSLMECLAYMNEINCKFQSLRNREYPSWKLSENIHYNCEYCHYAVSNNPEIF